MGNDFKVKIINYQRVRNAELTFVPGLNIIQGKSNAGKSAIIRALETAIYNIARESHVTLGETQSAVGISYNGHEVIWRRDKNSASQVSYRIDGKIYNKVGRGQPELVAKALEITEIEVNGRKFRVNFGKQMAYPFLLDSTPSEFFKFIVQSGEEENVTEVLDTMRKDYNEMKSNVKTYEATCNQLGAAYQKEAKAYNELRPKLEYAKQIIAIDGKVQEYKKLQQEAETLKKALEITSNLGAEVTRWTYIADELNMYCDRYLDKKGDFDNLVKTTQEYKDKTSVIVKSNIEIKDIAELVQRMSKLDAYRNILNQIQVLDARKKSIESMMAQATHYNNVIEVESERIKGIKASVEKKDEALNYWNEKKKVIKELMGTKDSLREESLKVFRTQRAVEDLNGRVDATKRIIEEIEAELMEFDVCPHCNAPIVNGKYCEHKEA